MKYLLVLILLVGCSTPVRQIEAKKTVIQKLAECTERYFSQHGVDPSEAFDICEKIYKGVK